MQNKEKLRYEEIGNWDFSDIKYITKRKANWDLYEQIKKYTKNNSLILDLGTGGCEKALKYLPDEATIIGTDFSPKMIDTANKNKEKYPNKKIKFCTMDNHNLSFPNNLFDIVVARHTSIDAKQIYNVLNKNGILFVEGVDKKDCLNLKETFKRGQAYNDKISISKIDYENIKKAGFKEVDFTEIIEYEYYKTKEDLIALLLKTPILDDFSELHNNSNTHLNEIDEKLLDIYINENTTKDGIKLERVLYGIIAKK